MTKVPQSLAEVLDISRRYIDTYAENEGWKNRAFADPVEDLEIFFNHLKNNHILDVGCGWGRYVGRFLKKGLQYRGLDFSSKMLKAARAKNPGVNFVEGSYTKLPFIDESFDGIWSCCSLSGIPKKYLKEALLEHRRILKPDGVMMVVMPASMDNEEGFCLDDAGKPENYIASYFLNEFEKYLQGAGFNVVQSGYRFKHGSMYTLVKKSS
jgi:ubiquinone/menaquinone biosynthesis C-methylase UbiE